MPSASGAVGAIAFRLNGSTAMSLFRIIPNKMAASADAETDHVHPDRGDPEPGDPEVPARQGSAGRRHRRFPRCRGRRAQASPLAGRLFDIPGVTGVFFGYDFITVTKDGRPDWQHLKPAILGAIMEHFMSGAPVMARGRQADAPATERRRVLRQGRRRDRRHDQGTARHARAPGRGPGRRRHHLPRLSRTAPCSCT